MENVLTFDSATVCLGAKSGKYPDGNQVLVRGADTQVAFDTPLLSAGIDADFNHVDLVILGHVHEDHIAGLHRFPLARVQVHEADLAAAQSWEGLARHYGYPDDVLKFMKHHIETEFHYQPRPDASGYADNALWELGGGVRVRAHHMPGHTAGHCVLVVENEGLAFLGDIDLTGFGPYYGDATSSLADFRRTLAAVAELDVKTWVTSHHRAVLTERETFLAELARFQYKIEERTARLLNQLNDGPLNMDELVRRRMLYPLRYQAPYVDSAERRSICMHLDELIADGRVCVLEDGRFCLS